MRRACRRAVVLAVVLAVSFVGAGCSKSPALGAEGRLEPAGNVLLTGRGGDPVSIRQERTLRSGDVVEVSDGTAVVQLPGGASLELRPRSVVVFDRGPELRTGDVLVVAPGAPQVVRSSGTAVAAAGVARLTQTLSLRVGTYAGSTTIESGGSAIDVPALRQVGVPAVGVVPGAPSPFILSREDPWDTRFLGDVLAATEPLERLARGFTDQLLSEQEGRTVGLYRVVLPALDPESAFRQTTVEQLGAPGEVLLAASVALLGRKGRFEDRIEAASAFRADGAPWALVAKDQDVPSLDVLQRTVEDAVNRVPAAALPPPAATAPTETSERASLNGTPAGRPTTPSRGTPPTTRPPSSPPTTAPPGGAPPDDDPEPPPDAVTAVVDPVVSLLDGLLGADAAEAA